jgi:pimeloyl-ACP methyl ester carboxylesterase
VGASDRPATGYDPQRRADDILEVIGSLAMQKPILIGNSCGGDILHALGARHPDRRQPTSDERAALLAYLRKLEKTSAT